jgi:hypothetical protein
LKAPLLLQTVITATNTRRLCIASSVYQAHRGIQLLDRNPQHNPSS